MDLYISLLLLFNGQIMCRFKLMCGPRRAVSDSNYGICLLEKQIAQRSLIAHRLLQMKVNEFELTLNKITADEMRKKNRLKQNKKKSDLDNCH